MLQKTRIIVLHHIRYRETGLVLHCYSEHLGRISCLVQGVFKKHSSFPATLFLPLTQLDAEIFQSRRGDLHRLRSASCHPVYTTIPFDPDKRNVALFIAELLHKTLREEESQSGLFAYLSGMLQWLDTQQGGTGMFLLYFMIHLTRYLGFFPGSIEERLSEPEGMAFARLSLNESQTLGYLMTHLPGNHSPVHLSRTCRQNLLEALVKYYTVHIDSMKHFKGLQILTEVYR